MLVNFCGARYPSIVNQRNRMACGVRGVTNSLAESIIQLTDWSSYNCSQGDAVKVGDMLRQLLSAPYSAEYDSLCFTIENVVASQGSPYDAAIPTAKILVASLYDSKDTHIRVAAIDLLIQIVRTQVTRGDSPSFESNENELMIKEQCREICKQAIWLLLGIYYSDRSEGLRELLVLLDAEPELLAAI